MKNKRIQTNKFRFNIIDALLILVIIVAAVSLSWIVTSRDVGKGNDGISEITYKIVVRNMREEFRNLVSVGDTIIDSVHLFTLGEVTDVSYSASKYTGTNKNTNEVVISDYPERIDMTITVSSPAEIIDGSYMIGGLEIAVGSYLSFRAPDFVAEGYCLEMDVNS